ncbi:hypothetical protein [Streptomyces sp. Root369]|uniref:hypothetical protein n=1 Tax=Streptomyces sp. Root369 TaxID=1736523 RepID=UPI00070A8521|nr:hypothetical protein [Streptomyces sp. Root369]KQW17677.1 hypothetical protein ASD08_01440 [Streptomyces sp. Root369]
MTEPGLELPPKASAEVIAGRDTLADEVCRELARAGLPVHRGDLGEGPHDRPGAKVYATPHIDGGVYVDWYTNSELHTSALELFSQGIDYSNPPPVVRHHSTVLQGMQEALLRILTSAGFQVEEPDGHTHGSMIHVKGLRP